MIAKCDADGLHQSLDILSNLVLSAYNTKLVGGLPCQCQWSSLSDYHIPIQQIMWEFKVESFELLTSSNFGVSICPPVSKLVQTNQIWWKSFIWHFAQAISYDDAISLYVNLYRWWTGNAAICRCLDGYTGGPLFRCNVDPCSPPCGTNADCESAGNRAVCKCRKGYEVRWSYETSWKDSHFYEITMQNSLAFFYFPRLNILLESVAC